MSWNKRNDRNNMHGATIKKNKIYFMYVHLLVLLRKFNP